MLPSLRPMVISSRTTGMTVLRPSSSSMMSFMVVPSKVRQSAYRTFEGDPKRLVPDVLVHLGAVVAAVGHVFLQPFHGCRPVVRVRVAVAHAAVGHPDGAL